MPDAVTSIYCDANAGSPVDPEVLACFLEVERAYPGNPASSHAPGRRARGVLEAARARIASALCVRHDDVLFTSGGTESANLAVRGLGDPTRPVLLGEVEHPAVMEPARERGVVLWQLDSRGAVVVAEPQQGVGLVSLVHAQSELGTLQPVLEAAALSKLLRVPMFVDAAQTLGRTSLDAMIAAVDAVALSPHKCGGMRGHGVLIVRDLTTRLRPLVRGGGQEHGLRPGTQSPALAAANALAIEQATNEVAARAANMAAVRDAFVRGIRASHVVHDVLTPFDASVPNTVMVRFPHVDGRNLLPALDLAGIHASHGSACSSGAPTAPRILLAMGLEEAAARTCVRFSFGWRDRADISEPAGRLVGDVVRTRQKIF